MSNVCDGVDDAKLDIDDKVDVMNALTDVQFRYHEIGTQLRLKTLETIKNRSFTDTIAMGAVIEEWLNRNYNTVKFGDPTWKKLVEVVANPNGGKNNSLAEKIASEHRKNTPSTAPTVLTSTATRPEPSIESGPDPKFFEETSKRVKTDGWGWKQEKVDFKRYDPTTRKDPKDICIRFSFGAVIPETGKKDTTRAGDYEMKNWPHGVAVIINNEKFISHCQREGTGVDEKNLIQAFCFLGYIVEVHRDCSAEKIYEIMDNIKKRDHSSYDSFVCCILSHGKEGHIHGSDSVAIPLETITTILNGDSCTTLVGKPKIFLMQACRGLRRDRGVRADGDEEEIEEKPHIVSDSAVRVVSDSDNKIPDVADFFFGYATPPGHVAWRNQDTGSWYISEMCRSLARNAPCSSLETMMKIAGRKVGEEYENGEFKQAPEVTTRLTKDVFFF